MKLTDLLAKLLSDESVSIVNVDKIHMIVTATFEDKTVIEYGADDENGLWEKVE